ncbi:MAG: GT2 family glycosyltransferase [Candidatus Krumholzibacteriia bacterium]|jgi:GT2 family glycosyltransferase
MPTELSVVSNEHGSSHEVEVAKDLPLAVIVVNWNGRALLPDCFASLQDARYKNVRVVMVDNGSEDDSVAWTRQWHPEVEIIETGANLRWAGGNNVGLRYLSREGFTGSILLLNNDTIVPQGSLSTMVQALVADPAAWLVTPRICYASDPATVWYDGGFVGRWSGWVKHHGIRKLAGKLDPGQRYVGYATGCAMMLGSEVLAKVGELDEDFFFYGEDTDYSLRVTKMGGHILHVPRALVLHKVSASLRGDSPRKCKLRTRSHIRLLRKHWPLRSWPLLVVSQLVYLTGHSVWRLWHGELASALAFWQGAGDELSGRVAE